MRMKEEAIGSHRRNPRGRTAFGFSITVLAGLLSVGIAVPVAAAPANQWGLNAINIDAAWGITEGSPDVTVAVIDSGIDSGHPAFRGRIVPGWNFVTNTGDVNDVGGHGTLVSGVAVGRDDNEGFRGAAPRVKVMPLVVSAADDEPEAFLATRSSAAVDYAIAHGADVINYSRGGMTAQPAMRDAIARANAAGIPVVVAAGNRGANLDQSPTYPAVYSRELPNVISVATIRADRTLGPGSNFGQLSVTLAAPGTQIRTTEIGGGYGNHNSTSLATPFVAGAVALMRSVNYALTPGQIREILSQTVTSEATLNRTTVSGGYLDAGRAVAEARDRRWNGKSVSIRSSLSPAEAVDATNAATPSGSLSLRPANENTEQTFKPVWVGDGWYRLESVRSPGSSITWNTLNQSAILASSNIRPDRMFWKIELLSSGMYRIVNKDDSRAVLIYTNIREVQVRHLSSDNRHTHWNLTPIGGALTGGARYTFAGTHATDAYARTAVSTPGATIEIRRGQNTAATWTVTYDRVRGGYRFSNLQSPNLFLTGDSTSPIHYATANTGNQTNQTWILRETAVGTYEIINFVLRDSLTPVFLDNQNQVTDGTRVVINPYNSTTSQQWHVRRN